RFRPTFDDAINRTSRLLDPLVRTIELGPVYQSSAIIHFHGVGFLWRRPASLFLYFILQSTGRRFYAGYRLVFSEKFFTFLGVLVRCFFVSRCCFFSHVFRKLRHHLAHFLRTQERLRPAQSIFQTRSKYVAINLHLLLLEGHPDVEPDAVTYFVLCVLERGPIFRKC